MTSLDDIAGAFRLLVRRLADGPATVSNRSLTGLGHQLFPQAQFVDLVEHRDGRLRALDGSDREAQTVLDIGDQTGQAPVLDALGSNDVVVCTDVDEERRWPAWAARVRAETTVSSALCYRLYLTRQHRVAFTVYSQWPHAFDDDVALGSILASYCSLALLTELVAGETLEAPRAQEVHREIGVAMSILIGRGAETAGAHRALHGAGLRLRERLQAPGEAPTSS